jgi:MFS family permease
MWELYALWAFLPLLIQHYAVKAGLANLNVSLVAFGAIAIGALGCVMGGELVSRYGSARIAFGQLLVSGIACLLVPLALHAGPVVFMLFLAVWGITVVGDSPQFSSLVGSSAPREYVGTAFTIVNCIGFAITAVSIQCLGFLSTCVPTEFLFSALAVGPLVGLISTKPLLRPEQGSRRPETS